MDDAVVRQTTFSWRAGVHTLCAMVDTQHREALLRAKLGLVLPGAQS